MRLLTLTLVFFSFTCFAQERLNLKSKTWHRIDKELQFQVVRVTDDSRCPEGARCVWAGQVHVEIEFDYKGIKDKVVFTPSHGLGKTVELVTFPIDDVTKKKNFLEGFQWKEKIYKLITVMPYPGKKEDEAYIFEISSSKQASDQ